MNAQRNELIQKINEYLPNELMTFSISTLNELFITFVNRKKQMSIIDETDWKHIQRNLDRKTSDIIETECSICCKDYSRIQQCSCSNCGGIYCLCYYILSLTCFI